MLGHVRSCPLPSTLWLTELLDSNHSPTSFAPSIPISTNHATIPCVGLLKRGLLIALSNKKIELVLYFTKTALFEDAHGSGSTAACILDLWGTCRWVILTPRPLYLKGLASSRPAVGVNPRGAVKYVWNRKVFCSRCSEGSRCRAVGMLTEIQRRYYRGVVGRYPAGSRDFHFQSTQAGCGTHPSFFRCFSGDVCLVLQRSEREVYR